MCNCTGSVTILRRSGNSAEVDVVVAVVILLDETQLQLLPQKLFVSTVEPVLVNSSWLPSESIHDMPCRQPPFRGMMVLNLFEGSAACQLDLPYALPLRSSHPIPARSPQHPALLSSSVPRQRIGSALALLFVPSGIMLLSLLSFLCDQTACRMQWYPSTYTHPSCSSFSSLLTRPLCWNASASAPLFLFLPVPSFDFVVPAVPSSLPSHGCVAPRHGSPSRHGAPSCTRGANIQWIACMTSSSGTEVGSLSATCPPSSATTTS